MKIFKKIGIGILAACIAIGATGCGNGGDETPEPSDNGGNTGGNTGGGDSGGSSGGGDGGSGGGDNGGSGADIIIVGGN